MEHRDLRFGWNRERTGCVGLVTHDCMVQAQISAVRVKTIGVWASDGWGSGPV